MRRKSAIRLGLAAALTCPAALAQWGPMQPSNPPSPRDNALLAFDLFHNRTLLVGGNSTDELWSLAGNSWTQLTPAVRPPARRFARLAADVLSGRILLYGGQGVGGATTALDDTWLWNGSQWQLLTPTASPGGLMWHGMAYDSQRLVWVVFGGRRNIFSPNEYLNETWEFSLLAGNWSQTLTASPPPALHRPAMCFHPGLGRTMLFGGEDLTGQGTDESWTFDGVNWTQLPAAGPTPPPRAGGHLVPILTRGIVVLVGGRDPQTQVILNDTWEHDGSQWREITNAYGGMYPPRAESAVTHDFVRDRLISFGGRIANNGLRNDTWEYGAHWQPFGIGCAGTAGVPTFAPGQLPQLGGVATVDIGNVPPGIPFAFVAVGLSRTQWLFGNLPMPLTGFGMPGCRSYTSADLLAYAPASNGIATWSWNVPNLPTVVGTPFYLQGVTFDPGANQLGLAVSPAATMVIGW